MQRGDVALRAVPGDVRGARPIDGHAGLVPGADRERRCRERTGSECEQRGGEACDREGRAPHRGHHMGEPLTRRGRCSATGSSTCWLLVVGEDLGHRLGQQVGALAQLARLARQLALGGLLLGGRHLGQRACAAGPARRRCAACPTSKRSRLVLQARGRVALGLEVGEERAHVGVVGAPAQVRDRPLEAGDVLPGARPGRPASRR